MENIIFGFATYLRVKEVCRQCFSTIPRVATDDMILLFLIVLNCQAS